MTRVALVIDYVAYIILMYNPYLDYAIHRLYIGVLRTPNVFNFSAANRRILDFFYMIERK